MLITFTPGEQDKQRSGRVCHSANPSLAHSSAVGGRGLIHTVWSGGGTKTFPHHKLGRNIKDNLQLSGSQTSCQPQLAPPHAHLERAGPCTGCSTHESPGHNATSSAKSPFFPGAFKDLYHPVPVQAHRTPWVFHQSANQVYFEGRLRMLSNFLQQWVSCQSSTFSSLALAVVCSGDSQTCYHQQALSEKVMTAMYYDTLKNAVRIHCFSGTGHKKLHNCEFTRVLLFFVTYIAVVPSSSRPGPGPMVLLAAELAQLQMMVPLHSKYC